MAEVNNMSVGSKLVLGQGESAMAKESPPVTEFEEQQGKKIYSVDNPFLTTGEATDRNCPFYTI